MALSLAPIAEFLPSEREDVVADMRAMAEALRKGPSLEMLPGAISWLTGTHEGYGDPSLWIGLPRWIRDQMERAAGDLAFALPDAQMAAWCALAEAAALVSWEEEE